MSTITSTASIQYLFQIQIIVAMFYSASPHPDWTLNSHFHSIHSLQPRWKLYLPSTLPKVHFVCIFLCIHHRILYTLCLSGLGGMDDRVCRFMAAQVAHAVNHIHGKGIVHRDIKSPKIPY
jgi:serine/threonine protein kinase